MRRRDTITRDMFPLPLIPQPVPKSPGSLSCRAEIAQTVGGALAGHDRHEVATVMSQLLNREISKHMLDAYAAESREDHIPPLDTAIALDMAVGNFHLTNLCASKLGARLSVGTEALYLELSKLERQRDESIRQVKCLRKLMEDLQK